MKTDFTVVELDRVVKFLDGLNKLRAQHGICFGSTEEVYLVVDGKGSPFLIDGDAGEPMSLLVSV